MRGNVSLRRSRLAFQAAPGAPAVSSDGVAIENVQAWNLREPVSRRAYAVVRIQTRSGIVGYGESSTLTAAEVDAARKSVVGRAVTAFEAAGVLLADSPAVRAAVNIAMLDAAAKAVKAPIYQFLGGPTRAKARALAPLDGDSDAALVDAMRRAQAAGYRAFQVPAPALGSRNQGQAYVLATRRRLDALRDAGGAGADFVLDGGGRLTPGDAQMIAAAVERSHLLWFNEPCSPVSLAASKKLSAEGVTPIGIGRRIRECREAQDLLREDAVDILRPDLGWNGISQIRRMAAIAETYYVAVGPVHDGGPIGTAAALQLAASIPNFFIQQIPFAAAGEDRRMRSEITAAPLETIRDGFVDLPAAPGLGITVNERSLDKYKESAA